MAKKIQDHSTQMELFGISVSPNDRPSVAPVALAAASSAAAALQPAATDSVKGDHIGTENPEPAATSGVPEVPITNLKTAVIPTTPDAAEVTVETEPTANRKGQKKPSRKPLLPINTGAEPMQASTATFYTVLAMTAGKSELEMHSPGPPVAPLNSDVLDEVRKNYLAQDDKYQLARAAHASNPPLVEKDEHLAGDRGRKRIERAMRDLVAIGAVETDVDGNPVAIQRLPEVKRILAGWGAVAVRCCSGGHRKLCDEAGNEIHSPLTRRATPGDKPLEQDHEEPDRRHG